MTYTATDWLYVVMPLLLYGAIVILLAVDGDHGRATNPIDIFFRRIASSLQRLTGYPGWVMASVLSGLHLLGMGLVGLYWDVAYHIDAGRDEQLLTPSHAMIVLALGGMLYTAGLAVVYASMERAPVRLRLGALRFPWSAVVLATLGAGGLAGFPLDALWHEAYGIDVTLWSPTHLLLVGGGGLAPIALWLMLAEGRPPSRPTLLGRVIEVVVFGAILAGLSATLGEFEFGVPQFQVLYLPLLVAAAAGFALVVARLALGPGGALKAVLAYVVLRGGVALVVGGALGHTVPLFPLYLGGALAVEAVAWWLGTERRLRLAAVSGVAVGTLGLAGELPWAGLLDWFQPSATAPPEVVVLGPVAAVAAAVVAVGLGRVVPGGTGVGPVPVVAALATLVAVLAYPLPREVGQVEAVIRLRPAGTGAGEATVDVQLHPADAAEEATGFGVVSWQGGGRVLGQLSQVAPGRYVSSRPMPLWGTWKTMVGLQRGDEVMAAPIYLPADPDIGAAEVPALPERRVAFVRNTEVLLRETHGGPAWPAAVSYAGLATVVAGWLALFWTTAVRLGSGAEAPAPPPPAPTRPGGRAEEARGGAAATTGWYG